MCVVNKKNCVFVDCTHNIIYLKFVYIPALYSLYSENKITFMISVTCLLDGMFAFGLKVVN